MRKMLIIIFCLMLSPAIAYSDEIDRLLGIDEHEMLAQHEGGPSDDIFFQRPKEGRGPGFGRMHQGMGKERLEQLRMVKILELLNMDEEKEIEFLPVFRTLRKAKMKADIERNKIIKRLTVEVRKEISNDSNILELVDELKEHDVKQQKEFKQILNRIEQILSPVQFGKLYIFQARFGPEVLGRMRDFQKRQRGMDHNWPMDPDQRDTN